MGMPGVYSVHYTKMSISITQEPVPGCGSLTGQWNMDGSQCYFLRGVNSLWGVLSILFNYTIQKPTGSY